MHTLDNHLAGVTANAPHPASYRPDFPLLTTGPSIFAVEQYHNGYDDGFQSGKRQGRTIGYDAGYSAASAGAQRKQERPSA